MNFGGVRTDKERLEKEFNKTNKWIDNTPGLIERKAWDMRARIKDKEIQP